MFSNKGISGLREGFRDTVRDFGISRGISGFRKGFRDFTRDFARDFDIPQKNLYRILKGDKHRGVYQGISRFREGLREYFGISLRISGFCLRFRDFQKGFPVVFSSRFRDFQQGDFGISLEILIEVSRHILIFRDFTRDFGISRGISKS